MHLCSENTRGAAPDFINKINNDTKVGKYFVFKCVEILHQKSQISTSLKWLYLAEGVLVVCAKLLNNT